MQEESNKPLALSEVFVGKKLDYCRLVEQPLKDSLAKEGYSEEILNPEKLLSKLKKLHDAHSSAGNLDTTKDPGNVEKQKVCREHFEKKMTEVKSLSNKACLFLRTRISQNIEAAINIKRRELLDTYKKEQATTSLPLPEYVEFRALYQAIKSTYEPSESINIDLAKSKLITLAHNKEPSTITITEIMDAMNFYAITIEKTAKTDAKGQCIVDPTTKDIEYHRIDELWLKTTLINIITISSNNEFKLPILHASLSDPTLPCVDLQTLITRYADHASNEAALRESKSTTSTAIKPAEPKSTTITAANAAVHYRDNNERSPP